MIIVLSGKNRFHYIDVDLYDVLVTINTIT